MVSLIVGAKGKGKTKILIEQANDAVKTASGHIVYIDKNNGHMHDLNIKIRLIDASRFPLKSGDEFIGFIMGIASQDHDLQKIFLDGFLKNTQVEDDKEKIKDYIYQLKGISELFNVDFVISLSKDKEELDPALLNFIDVAL